MKADRSFSNLLTAASRGWCERKGDEGVLSLALPLDEVDPLYHLPLLADEHPFQFLWDSAPGLCFAAAGQCQSLDLAGPRRFELAQRFSDTTLARLTDATPNAPAQARAKILLAFSFFDHPAERQRSQIHTSAVQAVLPRWQLSRQGRHGWLRLNGVITQQAEARDLAEQLWLMAENLLDPNHNSKDFWPSSVRGTTELQPWQECYRPALKRGLDLVSSGELNKLVLAVRQSIQLQAPLNPLPVLAKLRQQQSGSCRFLWRRTHEDAFFGASPERLLSLQGNQLRTDALAGTADRNDDGQGLLRSEKDRREHELVVASITNQLCNQGLTPRRPRNPQLARHGQLVHLHTPITANAMGHTSLNLAKILHPTPAVAGLPCREAMAWLRTLEPFERGSYAAPIGWIDSQGDTELRVAIRCGHARGSVLDLTAGAGLVRGSVVERELQEVGMKLSVLADQLDLDAKDQPRLTSKRAIT
ncbi:MAG: isochorismate synthase [Prochlorococcus sp. ALOHA_A2.0_51]|nr:isochorismate synthase [Prochlorococcus sp. ALOHA_A2.0_51]